MRFFGQWFLDRFWVIGVACLAVGTAVALGGGAGTRALPALPAADESVLFGGDHPTGQSIVTNWTCFTSFANTCPYFSGPCSGGGISCAYSCPTTEMVAGTGVQYQYFTTPSVPCPETQRATCTPGDYWGCWCNTGALVPTSGCSATVYIAYTLGNQFCF